MPDTIASNSQIVAAYRAKTPKSAAMAERAAEHLPSGIVHDGRYLTPYGTYVDHAQGPRKWDVDGNEYVDFFGGHGALLLGHNHPKVMAAVAEAMAQGTHFGANHIREVEWAERVCAMIPSAEKVRFTSSGTEATHMAVRLARAFTGKHRIVRIKTHFHGWHDHMTTGYASHFDGTPTAGVLDGVAGAVLLVEPGDIEGLRKALAEPDVAMMFVEPTGGSFGQIPILPEYLAAAREACTENGVILVFDEVITGFRVSPGGAQAEYGITPDMTTMAKILAGGLPGGAVAGRADILDRLDFGITADRKLEKIQHPGTFNANPVSAAAGITALDIIASTDACQTANDTAASLRAGFNKVLKEEGVPWASYGTFSGFHFHMNPAAPVDDPDSFDANAVPYATLKAKPPELVRKFRLAMLINGVDLGAWPGGLLSNTHGAAEVDQTLAAFRESLAMLRKEGEI